MWEEAAWFVTWVIILSGVHYQFKVCIPVTLFVLKLVESFFLLFLIKLFVFDQIHEEVMYFKQMSWELYNYTKDHFKTFDLRDQNKLGLLKSTCSELSITVSE